MALTISLSGMCLAEPPPPPVGEFCLDAIGLRIANPVAEMLKQVENPRFEIVALHLTEPARPFIRRQVPADVSRQPGSVISQSVR